MSGGSKMFLPFLLLFFLLLRLCSTFFVLTATVIISISEFVVMITDILPPVPVHAVRTWIQ